MPRGDSYRLSPSVAITTHNKLDSNTQDSVAERLMRLTADQIPASSNLAAVFFLFGRTLGYIIGFKYYFSVKD